MSNGAVTESLKLGGGRGRAPFRNAIPPRVAGGPATRPRATCIAAQGTTPRAPLSPGTLGYARHVRLPSPRVLPLGLALACTPDTVPPSVSILAPEEGAALCGPDVAVELAVEGLTLVDPNTDGGAGTGHVDVMLNGQDALMAASESFTLHGVEAGAWQLKVELSNADHTPVEPYAGDFLYIDVLPAEACGR